MQIVGHVTLPSPAKYSEMSQLQSHVGNKIFENVEPLFVIPITNTSSYRGAFYFTTKILETRATIVVVKF